MATQDPQEAYFNLQAKQLSAILAEDGLGTSPPDAFDLHPLDSVRFIALSEGHPPRGHKITNDHALRLCGLGGRAGWHCSRKAIVNHDALEVDWPFVESTSAELCMLHVEGWPR
uniref:Cupin_5 domain-containing protein n=1 Tax=Steinernema glaseri TaxID=37863 RepID=A0A1I7ZFD6_9BILA